LTLGYFLAVLSKYVLMYKFFLDCNSNLYEKLVFSVLRSPILFFDKTPTGRIVNRFSNDISVLDNVIIQIFCDVLDISALNIILIINIVINSPILIITCVLLLVFLYFYLTFCKPVLSHCRSLDLRHKSPIITTL
jgi:ATP-binding cassette, subfamily C (CFTR/MRP), member 4